METKPGIYTTEFWVSAITLIAVFISSIDDALPDKWAAIAAAVVAGLYAVARGLAKSGVGADPGVKANFRLLPRPSDYRRH